MLCPRCGGDSKVVDTQHSISGHRIYRTRKCLECGHKFTTDEVTHTDMRLLKKLLKESLETIDQLRSIISGLSFDILPKFNDYKDELTIVLEELDATVPLQKKGEKKNGTNHD